MGAFHGVRSLIPKLDTRVWILAAGRLLSQIGIGFTLFYAPIFFVNQVGLSATAVGLGLGCQSLSGLVGRFLGGSMADSTQWGRRRTLLLSAAISVLADGVFVITNNFTVFVIGNLLMGLGVGLYWPATEAAVADITHADSRNEAFATVRLADSLGLGMGVVLGGALIAATGAYRALFVIDGVTFALFFGIVAVAIAETLPDNATASNFWSGWGAALRDRTLLIFVAVNILFTTYLAQIQSTLPVYLNRFGTVGDTSGFPESVLSGLFTWHVALAAICQLPMARLLRKVSQARALILSVGLWATGFVGIYGAGTAETGAIAVSAMALGILALATVAYTPVASTLVVQLAPQDLRGVYLSVNSMCWAIGYLIGPPLGGWALDQPSLIAHGFWLGLAICALPGMVILRILGKQTPKSLTT
ncbi:MAG: MFS transporter [Cyanobacteria bacterium P01_G01_bin.38]